MYETETPLERIRKLDIVNYLASLGYQPETVKKDYEYWYLSPLRSERTASFKVNRQRNQWYDFGISKGGNLIDFGLHYFNVSIHGLIELFEHNNSLSKWAPALDHLHKGFQDEPKLIVQSVCPLYAYPLKNYLHERAVPIVIADSYCYEVRYEVNGKKGFGIGFKNDAGGYEIRNPYAKLCSRPKAITTFKFGAASAQVFEGFMDFLSWRSLHPYHDLRETDIVVLNGVGMLENAMPFLMEHDRVHLWLDRDTTGMRYTAYAQSLNQRFKDESSLYDGFKDLNHWLQHKGVRSKKKQQIRLKM
jgi:hypothetical protein